MSGDTVMTKNEKDVLICLLIVIGDIITNHEIIELIKFIISLLIK